MPRPNALLTITACLGVASLVGSTPAFAQFGQPNDPRFANRNDQLPFNYRTISPYVRNGILIPNTNPNTNYGRGRGNVNTVAGNFNVVPLTLSTAPDSTIFDQMARMNEIHGYDSPLSPFILRSNPPNSRPYRYRNGLWGRNAFYVTWGTTIFPGGSAYYPYYSPVWSTGYSCLSPYYLYWGLTAPFLMNDFVYQTPPNVIYVPVPVYTDGGNYHGWKQEDIDGYYLNKKAPADPNPKEKTKEGEKEPEKEKAEGLEGVAAVAIANSPVADVARAIQKAWVEQDVQSLADVVDKQKRVAIYLRGKYQYSLPPQDYLDLTRDALQSTKTQRFEIDTPQKKEKGVYLLTGKHTYKGADGENHVVYVSYVVERFNGKYIVTQVGTAPERITPKMVRESFNRRNDTDNTNGNFENKE